MTIHSPSLGQASLFLTLCTLLLGPGPSLAQEEVTAILKGEVRVGDAPMADGFVILHQVSAESSGEIDSVRVRADGTFQVRLPHVPDHASRPEIYFASVQFRGLHYFGPAITEAFQLDSLYLIQAYDTLPVPPGGVDLPLSARNLFLESREGGWMATDVLQISQEGDRTLFSPEEGIVWSYPLPESATDFQVGQSDMAPDAIRFSEGRVGVYSPLPPGERYIMVGYRIPEIGFSLPMPGRTDHLEVLVREPGPKVEFSSLSPSGPVEIETGNVYRRFVGDGFVDAVIQSEVTPEPWSLPAEWLGLLVAGLLGAAGVFGYRRRATHPPSESHTLGGSSRDDVLLAIATMDQNFQEQGDTSRDAKTEYDAERKRLLSILKRLT